jgi:hypothetical protein
MSVDISRLVLEIDSSGVVKASGNLDVFNQKSKAAVVETTKYEQELQKLNNILNTAANTGRYFNSSLDTIVQAQQLLQTSMMQMIQNGDASSDSLLKLAYQYNALGQEIEKLSGARTIMESYDSKMRKIDVATDLFGESLGTLQNRQIFVQKAMIELISA